MLPSTKRPKSPFRPVTRLPIKTVRGIRSSFLEEEFLIDPGRLACGRCPCCLSCRASIIPTLLALLSLLLIFFDPESLRLRGRSLKTFGCFRAPSGAQIFSSPSFRRSRERVRSFLAGCFEVSKFGAASLESRAGQRFLQTCGDAVDWELSS